MRSGRCADGVLTRSPGDRSRDPRSRPDPFRPNRQMHNTPPAMSQICMNLNLFQSRSLKTRVTLLTVGIFVLGIWLLAFYAGRMLRDDLQLLLGQQQLSTTQLLAREINNEINNRFGALANVARRVSPTMLAHPAGVKRQQPNPQHENPHGQKRHAGFERA